MSWGTDSTMYTFTGLLLSIEENSATKSDAMADFANFWSYIFLEITILPDNNWAKTFKQLLIHLLFHCAPLPALLRPSFLSSWPSLPVSFFVFFSHTCRLLLKSSRGAHVFQSFSHCLGSIVEFQGSTVAAPHNSSRVGQKLHTKALYGSLAFCVAPQRHRCSNSLLPYLGAPMSAWLHNSCHQVGDHGVHRNLQHQLPLFGINTTTWHHSKVRHCRWSFSEEFQPKEGM